MKFTCAQQDLSKALNIVSKAVSARTTIPILKGILLQTTSEGTLTLSSSDMDLSINKTIPVTVEEEGAVVVLAKLFGDIIRKLPEEDLLIEERENNQIFIGTASSEFTIMGIPAEEFPKIKEEPEAVQPLSFDSEILKEMIRKTAFAASIDETKGIIVGVLLETEPGQTNMAALDGFRMAVARTAIDNEEMVKIVISAKILNEIYKIISETEEVNEIMLIISKKKVTILMEDTTVVVRLMEGEFIKYKEILPAQKQTTMEIEKKVFQNSIERASLFAKEGKNNLIKLAIHNNLLTITSRSEEGNLKETIIMEKTGEDLEIGFNSKYIADFLKAIEDETIKLEFNTSTSPCLIKPVEGNSFEYLILPVRIGSN